MTVPKWLIPALAAVAALAVGLAAALFAVRFATPEDTVAHPVTIQAPVIAPVSETPSLSELVNGAEGDIPVSPITGSGEVIDPDSVPEGAIPDDIATLIDDLETADDPADVVPSGAAPAPSEPVGDPCADADPAGIDCPEGTPGTIFALDETCRRWLFAPREATTPNAPPLRRAPCGSWRTSMHPPPSP